ncbi:uncharacterized protein LOC143282258 [Babylonia areolata]|uniref:uncharacterized protein LOC143282258 n=1 Tax=Babylonia areolata TaxID=304850 RepID=UPI003FD45090
MGVVDRVVVMVMMGVMRGGGGESILLPGFSWDHCGAEFHTPATPPVQVLALNVSSPLTIPGQLTVHRLEARVVQPLPADVLLHFVLQANSSFGPDFPKTYPCFPGQGGSCAYKLCDLLTLTPDASSIRRQIVNALMGAGLSPGCPVSSPSLSPSSSSAASAVTIALSDVTLDIPSMLHTPMDTFINTNNYYLTARLVAGGQTLGCVRMLTPVRRVCQGWLCPQSEDQAIHFLTAGR